MHLSEHLPEHHRLQPEHIENQSEIALASIRETLEKEHAQLNAEWRSLQEEETPLLKGIVGSKRLEEIHERYMVIMDRIWELEQAMFKTMK